MAKTSPKEAKTVKTVAELQTEIDTLRADLARAKRGLVAGELQNPRVITKTRKEIARLLTAQRSLELAEEGEK